MCKLNNSKCHGKIEKTLSNILRKPGSLCGNMLQQRVVEVRECEYITNGVWESGGPCAWIPQCLHPKQHPIQYIMPMCPGQK